MRGLTPRGFHYGIWTDFNMAFGRNLDVTMNLLALARHWGQTS